VLDYEHRWEAVIDGFADSYLAGETPVPCVQCNQLIKFRDLLTTAQDLAPRRWPPATTWRRALPAGGRALYRARDPERDQSYFRLRPREQLKVLRFPLGERPRSRRAARAPVWPAVADKRQPDICFVPTGRYTEVIERLRRARRSRATCRSPRQGARPPRGHHPIHGWPAARLGSRRPSALCGAARCAARNVVVGPRSIAHQPHAAARRTGSARHDQQALCAGWRGVRAGALDRPPRPAWLSRGAHGIEVDLIAGEDGVSPGQACVFYDAPDGQARVLGGGIIQKAASLSEPAPAYEAASAGRL
jgi:tRNA-specific 2-thiouridylase